MSNKYTKKTLKVEGMSCIACSDRIENAIGKMSGVQEVKADYATSTVSITYDEKIVTLDQINRKLGKMDYPVSKDTEGTSTDNKEKKSDKQFIVIGILLLGAYLIIKNTVGFNFIPEIKPYMGYTVLFTVGILTSLHCVAMCGGINLSVCMSSVQVKENGSKYAKLLPSFLYNSGRVISYTIIGGLIGALGSVFSISNTGKAFITIGAGVFMIIMGLNMLEVFPWLRKLNPHMPRIFAKKINKQKTNKGPFVVGLLNGLMPCGPLQAMQLYALGTGSAIAGALSMFFFSLGTVPLLFLFGLIGSFLSSKAAKNMMKVSAALVMVLGIVMLNRGVAFTGFTMDSLSAKTTQVSIDHNTEQNAAQVSGDVQKITSILKAGSYDPITVQAGVAVEWTIVADESSLTGCNSEIIIPEYNITKQLVVGDNVITFTPTKSGTYGYSCGMGMIRSSITVTDAASGGTASANTTADSQTSGTDSLNASDAPVLSGTDTSGNVTSTGPVSSLPSCCSGISN